MEQIITVIVTGVCGVLTAGPVRVVRACFDLGDFGFVVAYLVKKTKQLEEKNKIKDAKIDALHNGFRQDVFTALVKHDKKIEALKTEIQAVKKVTDRKQIEAKK